MCARYYMEGRRSVNTALNQMGGVALLTAYNNLLFRLAASPHHAYGYRSFSHPTPCAVLRVLTTSVPHPEPLPSKPGN